MILAVAEQQNGRLNRATWEVIAAAQALPGDLPITVAIPGAELGQVSAEIARARVTRVLELRHPALGPYTADGFTAALEALMRSVGPTVVLFPHTYQTRDFAPALAARFGRGLVADCTGVKVRDGRLVFVRPMFQGKLAAEVAPDSEPPWFVTLQIGAFRADQVAYGSEPAPIEQVAVELDASAIRQRPGEAFQEARQAVDLSQAERIVAIGRGIKGKEHLPLVERLAAVLGAEIGASRPICDAGWLPMERQIGSSGQTVAPKLYVALGISGAIQHLVGMKSAKTIVAINKDPEAPIFEVADFGIVGDLFEIVPALIAQLEKAP